MSIKYFSHNGAIKPHDAAHVSLFDINYCYGYGVYETLKVRGGILYFVEDHCERLCHSAEIIGIDLPWGKEELATYIKELIVANGVKDANIKILCIGDSRGRRIAETDLYILMLAPLFPPRTLYSKGATAISAQGERHFPTAKSLEMLMSAICYRRARERNAYDALLINSKGYVTEGTRTNVFVTDGTTCYTPPRDCTLFGVTKKTVIECAARHGIPVEERNLPWEEYAAWQGVFLTSTSSKIVPLVLIDRLTFAIPPLIRDLMRYYNRYLDEYAATCVPILQE